MAKDVNPKYRCIDVAARIEKSRRGGASPFIDEERLTGKKPKMGY